LWQAEDVMFSSCSAGPRGLCGDPRIFDDLTKVPQVFRNPGGSPALQNERPIRCHEPLFLTITQENRRSVRLLA
jgi:hypothetical protein